MVLTSVDGLRPAQYKSLKYSVGEGVATITFNRPEAHNALSPMGYWELHWALVDAETDPEVDLVVLTGAGDRAFSAGGDLKAFAELYDLKDERRWIGYYYTVPSSMAFRQIESMQKVVISRVNGLAHGAGFLFVLFSDLSVAVDTADFRLPEPLAGIADPYGPGRLPDRIGTTRAKEMLLTGRRLSASEAHNLGAINYCVTRDSLDTTVDALIGAVRKSEPAARSWVKQLTNAPLPGLNLKAQIDTVGSNRGARGAKNFALLKQHEADR